MAPSPTAKAANAATRGIERDPEWETEMQVTFDSAELASFFDGFDPLDVTGDPDPTNKSNE